MDFTTNFCGPWWSDGKFQKSTCPQDTFPLNDFDFTCAEHDCSVSTAISEQQVREADNKFYEHNLGKSLKRTTAALAVKHFHPILRKITMSNLSSTPSLRGAQPFLYNPSLPDYGIASDDNYCYTGSAPVYDKSSAYASMAFVSQPQEENISVYSPYVYPGRLPTLNKNRSYRRRKKKTLQHKNK